MFGRLRQWWDRRKQDRARDAGRRRAAQEQAEYQQRLQTWERRHRELEEMIALADLDAGFDTARSEGIVLKRGESLYLELDGATLIEARRQRGEYAGGSRGVSVRLAKGVSYRVGAHRGTYQPGPEAPTVIDHGAVYVTDRRVAFQGPLHTREWSFAKLVALDHVDDAPITMLSVSNRQKTSGFGYSEDVAERVRFRLDIALARHRGSIDTLRTRIRAELQRHEALRPESPAELPLGASRELPPRTDT